MIIFYCDRYQCSLAESPSYKHYSRHLPAEKNYNNETLTEPDDDSGMCHLAVKCPSVSKLSK